MAMLRFRGARCPPGPAPLKITLLLLGSGPALAEARGLQSRAGGSGAGDFDGAPFTVQQPPLGEAQDVTKASAAAAAAARPGRLLPLAAKLFSPSPVTCPGLCSWQKLVQGSGRAASLAFEYPFKSTYPSAALFRVRLGELLPATDPAWLKPEVRAGKLRTRHRLLAPPRPALPRPCAPCRHALDC